LTADGGVQTNNVVFEGLSLGVSGSGQRQVISGVEAVEKAT